MAYRLLKLKIKRTDLEDESAKDKLVEMLDVFYVGERITTEQYQELSELLA